VLRLVPRRLRAIDRRHLAPGIAAFAAASLVALLGLRATAGEPAQPPAPRSGIAELQLLGVNDFHGHLEPPAAGLGGAAWLGAHLNRAASTDPERTIRVHAGDMVGASPLISSHWKDEPTIEATNLMRFDVGTVGNHEFDEGGEEMLRLIRRAHYPYIAANTFTPDGKLVLPPYEIVERDGVRVGFIGVTTTDTPNYLLPEYASEYRWTDISDTVNRWVPELRSRGVEAIVVLAHSGAVQRGAAAAAGEIVDEAAQMDDAVDVVVAGHTHTRLDTVVDGKLVVQALSYGTAYDRVRLAVDRRTGDVVRKRADIVRTVHAGIRPEPDLDHLVRTYAERVAPLAGRVVGSAAHDLGEDELGQIVADAQREYAGADVALVNPGNMRARLRAGPVTYADLFEVHAYEHPLVRMRLPGSALLDVLDRQHVPGSYVHLYRSGLPDPVDPNATYTVVAPGVIAGGDRFSAMRDQGTHRQVVGTDLEALVAWFEHH
jgi:5'-nucleotidase